MFVSKEIHIPCSVGGFKHAGDDEEQVRAGVGLGFGRECQSLFVSPFVSIFTIRQIAVGVMLKQNFQGQ
jgi:hypothetical protein